MTDIKNNTRRLECEATTTLLLTLFLYQSIKKSKLRQNISNIVYKFKLYIYKLLVHLKKAVKIIVNEDL